ncbi:MAG: carboxypeptidase-like regulatory domain-containing protein, partial [Bacteroidales bacterium]|nr:carboxypeptidase-like regulatory domain-containing protein [Bacteroidales bacterium]
MTLFLSLAGTVGAFAQQRTVTGTVRDTKQEPVVGAGVLIEGTTRGTVTGVDGSFSLAVPAGTVILDVSSLGYSPQKVTVSPGQAVVSVILEEDAM